jgi:hypothetical protein
MTTQSHWLTQYDPADGEPYGTVCGCSIGEDHNLADMEDEGGEAL